MKSRFGSAVAIALLWSITAVASAQEVVTLKVHHFLPPTANAQVKFIVPWCDRIARDSGGRLECRIFPAMQLGGTPQQLVDQAKDGVADVVWTVTGYTPGRFPKTEVFELPFMMIDPEGTARSMWEFSQTQAAEEFKDLHLLALHPHGPGVFHSVKRPITTLADLRGMRVRAPTRLTNRLLASFGATPVGMPMTQVAESLSKGVIDGALMPWEVVPAVKVQELVKFHSETDHSQHAVYTTVLMLAMNKARYDSLPPDLKKVIDANSGIELSVLGAKALLEGDVAGRLTASRNAINVIPAAELENWKKASQTVIGGWVGEMNAKGVDGKALLATARAVIDKNSKQ